MSAGPSITVRVPLAIRHRPGRRTIVTPGEGGRAATIRTRADPAMVKALARAFRWKRMLDDGRYASISEIATAEKIDRGYVGSILRLTLLAPDIVETILDGRQPDGLGLPALLEPFPIAWDQQRTLWFGAAEGPGESTGGVRTSYGFTASNFSLLATEHHRGRRPKRRTSVAQARDAVP
jgi:hypothetical protein